MEAVSVIAIAKTIVLVIMPLVSGFFPIFSQAFPPIKPCPSEGPNPPIPIQIPAATQAATLTQFTTSAPTTGMLKPFLFVTFELANNIRRLFFIVKQRKEFR